MTIPARWLKSSQSQPSENCVEVDMSTRRRVRDSKNPEGPVIEADVSTFLSMVRDGKIS